MGDLKAANEARYIHGEFGKGQWTFYGGHDPEDYQHLVGDPTDRPFIASQLSRIQTDTQ